jgi:hypothetical protein
VKKPRAWLDQPNNVVPVRFSHATDAASEALMQPAQTGSIISARLN